MKARAIQKNVHISSRKAGLVCDLIRNKKASEAIVALNNTNKKASRVVLKVLSSAIANATNNHAMDFSKLYVYQAVANQGRTLKRSLPRAKGSANMIRKRHSHIEVVLSDDTNERAKELSAIKARVAKRAKNQVKSTSQVQKGDQ